jgi:hypothetical protein
MIQIGKVVRVRQRPEKAKAKEKVSCAPKQIMHPVHPAPVNYFKRIFETFKVFNQS